MAVIDFDVHHGNGTEEILSSDGRFFFVSTHARAPSFYPESGNSDHQSKNVINVDLSKGFTFTDFLQSWHEEEVEARLAEFQPQLIILSSGFDANKSDPSKGGVAEAHT